MTAIHAAYARQSKASLQIQKPSIALFDSRKKIGAKILISGGTRCNVTNRLVRETDYWGAPKHFVRHVFKAFTPAQTIDFFKRIGVELVLEPSGKFFPATHSGRTVLEALIREVESQNVFLKTPVRVLDVEIEKEFFFLSTRAEDGAPKQFFRARRVVLCTGGLSLPETGSDGVGLAIARKLGHEMVLTAPALTPFKSQDKLWAELSGVALKTRLDFYLNGKKKSESEGDFLFTHEGFSGPVCLDISRHFTTANLKDKPEIRACFLPSTGAHELSVELKSISGATGTLFRFLNQKHGLPRRFAETMIRKCGWEGMDRLPDNWRAVFSQHLLNYPLEVSGVVGYRKAEVTAGGVDLKQVNISSMESKKIKGLYFAGEILDVDGRIGGFNFQWSWSSGAVAGRSAMESLL